MTNAERALSFNAIADRYAKARPGYPEGVFEAIAREFTTTKGTRLLEVGSGTGKATTGLVGQGFEAVALEPGAAMIDQSRLLPQLSGVRFLHTTFEAWDPSEEQPFQVVSAAQAWHWVDPAIGYRKAAAILQPGGLLAIFGSVTPFPAGSLKEKLGAIYLRHAADMRDRDGGPLETYYTSRGPIPDQIAESRLFDPVEIQAFPWTQTYRTTDYLALISTYSDHQMLGEARLGPLLQDLGAAIDAHGGSVRLPSETNLFLARKRAPAQARL